MALKKSPDEIVQGYLDRKVAHKFLNDKLIRVVFEEKQDKIVVITIYPSRKGRYEQW